MARRTLTDEEIRASIPAARARGAEAERIEPRAVEARFDAGTGRIWVELFNGCLFAFPVGASQELEGASEEDLTGLEVWQDGEGLHWEALDVDISVPGIMARLLNLREWGARYMGQLTSEAKARAARENGKKGGRPRRKVPRG
jgi:hypothetical protein